MRTLARLGGLGILAGLAACNPEGTNPNPSGPTPFLDHDMAVVAADGVGEDVEVMQESGSLATLSPSFAPPAGDFRLTGCTYSSATQRVECPPVDRNGLTITRSFKFFDANNAVQQSYDAETTAKANILATVRGAVSREHWDASVDRQRELNVTGLAGQETQRTWNGGGSGTVTRSKHTDGGEARIYDLTYQSTVVNVVIPFPHTEGSWPLSGTITRHVVVKVTGGPATGRPSSGT